MLKLSKEHLDEVKKVAEEAYPHECCGILVGSVDAAGVKGVTRLVTAENQRKDSPANRYLISPEAIQQVERELRGTGFSILGFFHSHPDVPARPSQFDQDHAWPWYSYLIVSVRKGQAAEALNWRLRDDRTAFESETLDCPEAGPAS